VSPLQHGQLLAQGEVLQHEAPASAKEAKYGSGPEAEQVKHGSNLSTGGPVGVPAKLLISKPYGIVTRGTGMWAYSLQLMIVNRFVGFV